MTKEEKKEITAGTTVKAIITGYIAYGVLIGFVLIALGACVTWCINMLPNADYRTLSISIPLIVSLILYFVLHGICKLSIYDVLKKCKTNPDNLPKIISRIDLFIIICIAFYIISTSGLLMININNELKSIAVATYQYTSIHSQEFVKILSDEMLSEFAENRTNMIISTSILCVGMIISLASVMPLQEKLIKKYNEF